MGARTDAELLLLPIEVHYVNGDPTDNRIQNTMPLCVDCHRSATFPGFGAVQ